MREQQTKFVQVIRPLAEYSVQAGKQRVAAYCRVSTDSEDQVNSFLNQVRYYTDFIQSSENMELVDIYADEGITGTSVYKREEFKRMMRDAKLGKIDRIYVKSVQRFARNSLECLEAVRKLTEYGVSVCFENDRIDTKSMSSEMILYIKSAFAQNDSLAYSKRMATAYRMKMEEGNFVTYSAPYGYRLENGALTIEPKEAETVLRIFDLYLSGNGVGKIAVILNDEGIPSRNGRWLGAHIRYILSNEKYIGDALLQKKFTPNVLPLKQQRNRGQRDQFYVTSTHPAIVTHEMFNSVQERRKEQGRYAPKTPKQTHLFTNKIECGDCGWAYRRREQNGIAYWVCSGKSDVWQECHSTNLSEDRIHATFVRMYNRLRRFETILIDQTLTQLIEARTKLISDSREIAEIDSEIAGLCAKNDTYSKLRAKRIMDEISYAEQTAELQDRIAVLRSRRNKLMKDGDDDHYIEELRNLKTILSDAPSAILSFDQKLFSMIVEKIRVEGSNEIAFVLKGGLTLKERGGDAE